MKSLAKNWLTNGLIDFEYKKYLMLSYLKYVHQHFSDKKLFPELADIIEHLKNLQFLKESKKTVENAFPRSIDRIDLTNQKILYKNKIKDSEFLEELDIIIEYGLKLFSEEVRIGNEMAKMIKDLITIEPIGITPIYKSEGYLFISEGEYDTVRVYKYALSPIKGLENPDEQMKTRYIGTRKKTIVNTLESMKKEIINLDENLPNPAIYAVFSANKFPFEETYLPITKRILITQLAA